MGSTKWSTSFGEETLSFQIAFADSALEAIGVIVLIQRLHPPIAGGNGQSAANALGGEQIVPVLLAIGKAVFQVE